MKNFKLISAVILISVFSLSKVMAQCTPAGDPSVYGDHVWNVYAWNSGGPIVSSNSWSYNYAGYYVDNTLNFNSQTRWDPYNSPSYASGYVGCPVNFDYHSWSAERKGFTCGVYRIDVLFNYDAAQLFVHGVKVWERNYGTSSAYTNAWTGLLDDTSAVIFRGTTGFLFSEGAITLTPMVFQSTQTNFCPNYPGQLTAVTSGSYLWSTGETTQSISVNTTGNYSVAITTNGCTTSASQQITVAPLDTPVVPSGLNLCNTLNNTFYFSIPNFNSQLSYSWNSSHVVQVAPNSYYIRRAGDYIVTATDPLGCAASSHMTIAGAANADSVLGKNFWKVNEYLNYGSIAWFGDNYVGYYSDSSLSFNSQNKWSPSGVPEQAQGFHGCSGILTSDAFSWSANRKGFPCGIYRIDVLNNDDEADLFVNGVLVWQRLSASPALASNVWTGVLDASATVELKVKEYGGNTFAAINLVPVAPAAAFITVTGKPVVCTGQSYALASTIHGTSYLWSNGETTNPAHATQSGNYAVTVTQASGCAITFDPASVNILPNAAPVAHITTSSNSICDWNPVTLSSDSIQGNIWSTNENTQSISTLKIGEYSLSVTNSAGCVSSDSLTLVRGGFTPPAPIATSFANCAHSSLTLNASGLAPGGLAGSCNGDGNKYVVVSKEIPQTNITIEMWVKSTADGPIYNSWNDNDVMMDRLYIVNGYLYTGTLDYPEWNSGFYIADGIWHHIAFTIQSGVGETIYVDGVSSGVGSTFDHAALAPQNLLFIGVDLFGDPYNFDGQIDNLRIWSEVRSQDEIRNNMLLETPLSSANLIYQSSFEGSVDIGDPYNGADYLQYTPVSYYTYTWSGPGAPPPSSSPTQTTSSFSAGATYAVTASAGCSPSQASSTVATVNSIPAPTVTSNNGPVCQNSTVNLTAGGLAPGGQAASFNGTNQSVDVTQDIPETDFTIEMWVKTTLANTGIFSATSSTGGYDRNLYLSNGQLNVRVYNSNGWNSGITINDGTWHHIALTVQTGVGQKMYIDGIPAPNSNTYDHSDFNWQDQFRIGYTEDAVPNHYFNGEIDNVRIWSEARTQADIQNNMSLETPLSSSDLVYQCSFNGNVNTVIGNNGATPNGISFVNPDYYTYAWSGPGAPSPSTSETQTTSALSAGGIYHVTATVGDCAPSPAATTSVIITPLVNYYTDADGDSYGSSSASAVSSCTNPGSGYVTNNTDCNDAKNTIHPGSADICNSIDDNCNGQIDENSIIASITPAGIVNVCKGSTFSITANGGSGINYQWSKGSSIIAGATGQTFSPVKTGAYSVKETNSYSCSATSSTASVTIVTKPAAVIVASGNLNICGTGSVVLQASSGLGYTYQWMKGSSNIAGATNQNYTATTKGSYKVVVSNSTGCSKTSNTLKVIKSCKMDDGNAGDEIIADDLNIYPNPTSGKFMVNLKIAGADDDAFELFVVNTLGQVVYADGGAMIGGALEKEISLSSQTAQGMFILRVIVNGKTYQRTLILQH